MIRIRSVEPDDDAQLAAIIREPFDEHDMPKTHTVYDDPDTDRQYEVFHDQPRAQLWVAEEEGQVLGSCGVYPTKGLPDGWCEIVKFYVRSTQRGNGLGTRLFRRALLSAGAFGYATAYLETFPQFASAVSMYRRMGFKAIDHQVGCSGHTATSIWMTRDMTVSHFDDDDMKWNVLHSENIIHHPHLDAYHERVQLPNGTVYEDFYHLHFSPVVCIVAETTDGRILLERQYRHAVGEVLTEPPAGIVEKGEEPLVAAKRELLEETGFGGGEWKQLCVEYAQGGVQDNKMYSFYAKGVVPQKSQHLDQTEDIRVFPIERTKVLAMLLNGEIRQSPVTSALWKYFALYTDLLGKL
jgi:8-oxo-dGTP pyrophosphatase MutT (NUDIX family)/ribosomal protein S18 acetylase RimI-like enzyme